MKIATLRENHRSVSSLCGSREELTNELSLIREDKGEKAMNYTTARQETLFPILQMFRFPMFLSHFVPIT